MRLPYVAATLPLPVADPSLTRRRRRWLAKAKVPVRDRVGPAAPARARHQVAPKQALSRQEPWPDHQRADLRTMMAAIVTALPPGCTTTSITDREDQLPEAIDLYRERGWHDLVRQRRSAT